VTVLFWTCLVVFLLFVVHHRDVTAAVRSDSRRKYTAVSVAFIVFVTSNSTEHGVSMKFCAELEKTGTDWWAELGFCRRRRRRWFSDEFFIMKRLLR